MRISNDQMTLGQMIKVLETCDPSHRVQYDFCDTYPSGFFSYRGYYEDGCLGWKSIHDEYTPIFVADFLKLLKQAVGKIFQGYKGGDYRMGNDTVVWVSNYGTCGNTYVKGIHKLTYGGVIILTGYDDS